MQFFRGFLLSMMSLAVVAGCARTELAEPATVPQAQPYVLDSGDQLRIVVFGQDDLSGDYIVDSGGFISMPLVSRIEARNRTSQELETAIADKLRADELVVDPSVSVQVVNYRPFFILGEVNRPGQFTYVANMSVLTAVAIAGGFTYRADPDDLTITRRVGDQIVEERVQRNTYVLPGDVIYVRERIL